MFENVFACFIELVRVLAGGLTRPTLRQDKGLRAFRGSRLGKS